MEADPCQALDIYYRAYALHRLPVTKSNFQARIYPGAIDAPVQRDGGEPKRLEEQLKA